MRYLIVSDIHANWEALESVVEDAAGQFDEILCLGDIVGYGADPNAVVDWTRDNVKAIVRGNHDKVAMGSEDIAWFNPDAQQGALWTRRELSDRSLEYVRSLPKGPIEIGEFQLVHGSPLDEDDYLLNRFEAEQLWGYLESPIIFFGHTHVQGGFQLHRNGSRQVEQVPPADTYAELLLADDWVHLINPGSIGQPRDGDPRAAYAIYEPEEQLVRYRRVAYDIATAQRKIIAAGLPQTLALRLAVGG